MGLLIAAVLEAWTAGYTAFTAPSTLKEFRSLFAGFGADLPGSTKALMAMPFLWMPFAFVAIAMLVWIGARGQPSAIERRRMKLALWGFGILFGLTIAWAGVALYVPIFKLGAAV
jgi:type II secretory pathway component PulF